MTWIKLLMPLLKEPKMPYIKQGLRDKLDGQIEALKNTIGEICVDNTEHGILNYVLTQLLTCPNPTYEYINGVIGVLECSKLEFYRRLAMPYEDNAASKNGDIMVYKSVDIRYNKDR